MVPTAYRKSWPEHQQRFNQDYLSMSSNTIAIHLPDGAIREVPAGTTPLEIANSISPRLAAAAVVARLAPLTATQPTASDGKSEGSSAEAPAEAAMYASEDTT